MPHSTTLEHMQTLCSHNQLSKKYQKLVLKGSAIQNKFTSNFK